MIHFAWRIAGSHFAGRCSGSASRPRAFWPHGRSLLHGDKERRLARPLAKLATPANRRRSSSTRGRPHTPVLIATVGASSVFKVNNEQLALSRVRTQLVIAVIRRGGEILLVNESLSKNDELSWSLPGGGVEEGELLHEALIREVKEETGLDVVEIGTLALRNTLIPPPFHPLRPVLSRSPIGLARLNPSTWKSSKLVSSALMTRFAFWARFPVQSSANR